MALSVGGGKELAGEPCRGKELRLGGKDGQAHNIARDKVNAIRLLFIVAYDFMQVEFEMKIQVIRSQGRTSRLFVNIPLALAAALDIQSGERVRWQLLGRSELRLVRLEAPSPAKGLKK